MTVRITLKRILLALLAAALAGILFAWSGLFQIAASSGHWPITNWFLHWTMQNSVRTYSTVQTPDIVRDDRSMVSAAGHFRQSCAVCHGAPGVAPSPAMQQATPAAPDLAKTVGHYSDRDLFWIVQHGVKYTGMPAWPTQSRPDEVARMVGFLRKLPEMSAARFRALSQGRDPGNVQADPIVPLENCVGCHGADGRGRGQGDIPILAGQSEAYLRRALVRYRAGERASGPMQVAAATLDNAAIAALSRYYAALPGLSDRPLPNTHPLISEGKKDIQLPACANCHAPGKIAPRIAGQRTTYLAGRLHGWHAEEGSVESDQPQQPMPVIARRIPSDEIEALAAAIAMD